MSESTHTRGAGTGSTTNAGWRDQSRPCVCGGLWEAGEQAASKNRKAAVFLTMASTSRDVEGHQQLGSTRFGGLLHLAHATHEPIVLVERFAVAVELLQVKGLEAASGYRD